MGTFYVAASGYLNSLGFYLFISAVGVERRRCMQSLQIAKRRRNVLAHILSPLVRFVPFRNDKKEQPDSVPLGPIAFASNPSKP